MAPHPYLPLYFPEADRFHRSSRTDWFLALLEMFPSPLMIAAMTKEEFTTAAGEVVGRKVEKSVISSDIYETTKASAGLPVSPDPDAIQMFRLMLAEGRSLIRQRNAIEDRAVELLGPWPDCLHPLAGDPANMGPKVPDRFIADRDATFVDKILDVS